MNVVSRTTLATMFAAILAGTFPSSISAQAAPPPDQPRFDVSTVRVSDPAAGRGGSLNANGDSLKAHNVTLFMLIRAAYGLSDDQVSGGPDWIRSTRFDLSAKTDKPIDRDLKPEIVRVQQQQMFQQLLAERFRLRLRHETRDIPGYQLVVAKNGPRGVQSMGDSDRGITITDGKLKATGISMDELAMVLEQRILEAPVKNTTGLSGKFNLDLTWDPKQTRAVAAADAATDNGPSIFLALQQQLGLRLEPHKTPADAIVIDSAQMPQEN
ncbi:MAG TPA: TIGR03435 family protein [Acidobacteriaceae bacterium]|nr:TIGR03435 family protein [Acidobacteriaceae bacterium]